MSTNHIIGADLFCGAGGFTTGLLAAARELELDVQLLAINHWEVAISTHSANHPNVRHLCESLDGVNPRKVIPEGRLNLLTASPECTHHARARGGRPMNDQSRATAWHILRWAEALYIDNILVENVPEFCFPGETAVLCKRGMVPISEIRIGDEVWTHNARWKPVTAVSKRIADTVSIKGYGNSIIEATPNHQFYARQYAPKITRSGKYGRHAIRLLEPEWVRADRLADIDNTSTYTQKYSGYAWASPCELPNYWMRIPKTLGVDVAAPAFFYMLGRWVGDGWIRKRKQRQDLVRICTNVADADAMEQKLAETGLAWTRENHTSTVDVFTLSAQESRILIPWITRHFGEYAHKKTIPAWLYGASEDQRWAFINGYRDADGYVQQDNLVSTTSVSRCLSVGIRLLLHSLGVTAHISKIDASIQSAVSNPDMQMHCKAAYTLHWRSSIQWEKCDRRDLHIWGPVREVMPCREGVEVFDITVADDHSFIADGQVVHNCDWGPLGSDGRPIKSKKGTYFKQFIGFLRTMGYTVSYKVLNAADYGDATTRRRLFIQARRGKHIKWPARSHAPQNEYANDGGSAWRPAREVIDWSIPGESIFSRKRPLCAATMRRIMTGLEKYSGLQPFLVKYYEGSDACSIDEPLPTITANYEHLGLCRPYVVVLRNHSDARSVDEPLPTITAGGNHVGLAKPFIIPYYSERDGQAPRCHDLDEPLPTVTAGGNRFALCEPYIVNNKGCSIGRDVDRPLPTITAHASHLYVAEPFVIQYNGQGGPRSVEQPLGTITTHDRFGLVLPEVVCDGKTIGLLDIYYRMLQPHELSRAMSFPDDYRFSGNRTERVRQIGNAVPVHMATALCKAVLS